MNADNFCLRLPKKRRHSDLSLYRGLGQMGAILLSAFALGGCAQLERMEMRPTEAYYLSKTTEQFPKKPREFEMPMLSQPPPRSATVGVFQFTTNRGRDFAMKSASYNAKRVGADAVWVRHVTEWAEPYAYDIEAHWESRWDTVYHRRTVRSKGKAGGPDQVSEETVPVTIQRHEWVPSRHVSGFHHYASIDALMLKLP